MKRFVYPLLSFSVFVGCTPEIRTIPLPKGPHSSGTEAVPVSPPTQIKPVAMDLIPVKIPSAIDFLEQVEPKLKTLWSLQERAQFILGTHFTEDTKKFAAQAAENVMSYLAEIAPKAGFLINETNLSDVAKRKLKLITVAQPLPAPMDKTKQKALSEVAIEMQSAYGEAKYCPSKDQCYSQTDLIKKIKNKDLITKKNSDQLLDTWVGWHNQASSIRENYTKFVTLANEGAKNLGYPDLGALWRSNYDMPPDEFEQEVERLWTQVEPLYKSLHCYVRSRLSSHYGADKVPNKGLIPAHLLGNMWAQEWGNIYPIVLPFPEKKENQLDLEKLLKAKVNKLIPTPNYKKIASSRKNKSQPLFVEQADKWFAHQKAEAEFVVKIGEGFFTSLGLPALPKTFWERSMITNPRDREVECHASAVDITWEGDVRLKMCTDLSTDSFYTVHHELGHDYYFLAYQPLDAIFEQSAHDGFHEAVGDTMTLSITPTYLKQIGLIDQVPKTSKEQEINQLLKRALERVAFLPFGKTIDQWRWKVFSGEITPENYNQAWWDMRAKYQGIAPPVQRTEKEFDPGAKYHVPANVPYMRYFLARILQFQFHKALCKIAGNEGPLHRCSIYGSKEAGEKLWAMLKMGASKPWPEALQTLSGESKMDAAALLEYFQPLKTWLDEQNQGQTCGW